MGHLAYYGRWEHVYTSRRTNWLAQFAISHWGFASAVPTRDERATSEILPGLMAARR